MFPFLLLLLPSTIFSQSSHDESLRVILCSSLICDPPKVCDIFEGIPQCRPPPPTTSTTLSTTTPPKPSFPALLWTTPTPFPTFALSSSIPLSSSTPPSECSLPPDTGPCTRSRIMWYFDTETSSCQRFSYSGCGNGNRFSSRYQCELRCHSREEENEENIN